MLVPVIVVAGVAMAVVQVIDVIAVLDGVMSAPRAVHVIVGEVHDVQRRRITFVPVAAVIMMSVAIVQVIDMIAVAHRDVATVRTVHVLDVLLRSMGGMSGMVGGTHDETAFLGRGATGGLDDGAVTARSSRGSDEQRAQRPTRSSLCCAPSKPAW